LRRRLLRRRLRLRQADGGAKGEKEHAGKQDSGKRRRRDHHAFAVYRRVLQRFGRKSGRGVTKEFVIEAVRRRSSSSSK
jgi:hypothetical protein